MIVGYPSSARPPSMKRFGTRVVRRNGPASDGGTGMLDDESDGGGQKRQGTQRTSFHRTVHTLKLERATHERFRTQKVASS